MWAGTLVPTLVSHLVHCSTMLWFSLIFSLPSKIDWFWELTPWPGAHVEFAKTSCRHEGPQHRHEGVGVSPGAAGLEQLALADLTVSPSYVLKSNRVERPKKVSTCYFPKRSFQHYKKYKVQELGECPSHKWHFLKMLDTPPFSWHSEGNQKKTN